MTDSTLNESEFRQRADQLFAQIEQALEALEDIDWRLEGGVLTLEFDDGSQVVINQHAPNREIWLAAKSGGFHYAWREGDWIGTRDGVALLPALAVLIRKHGGGDVDFG